MTDDVALVLDPALQGLPDMAHGGTVLALFDAAAAHVGARVVHGHYRKRVPLDVRLRLTLASHDGVTACRLTDESSALLVDGTVTPLLDVRVDMPEASDGDARSERGSEGAGLREPERQDSAMARARPEGVGPLRSSRHPSPSGTPAAPVLGDRPPPTSLSTSSTYPLHELPVSRTCFVCGTDNVIGLRARFQFDDERVRATWHPTESVRERDGTLAPVALTALLDEAAFWLGALATGESGMTTELAVDIHRLPSFDSVITVVGDRDRVTMHANDQRYRDTDITALDDTGRVVAAGRITFAAVRGAARKLASRMLAMNPPETIRRVFPSYAP